MSSMYKKQTKKWYEVDQPVSGLETDLFHQIYVQREAIPLVFVPGIMGSRLRSTGTDGKGDHYGADGLPNLRWDGPSNLDFLLKHFSGSDGRQRKSMLVGPKFKDDYLEVDNQKPIGDGFHGVLAEYCEKFLNPLKNSFWGPLQKIFEFPVYAVGYNWTDDAKNSGQKLAYRITDIICEADAVTGFCERVILITHSMGGLVARWASEFGGAKSQILGIIHGVQPVTGAPAAYWRMKGGFEAPGAWLKGLTNVITSNILGPSGPTVTPVLGNIPGGLELLPNKLHRTNDGSPRWLTITENGVLLKSVPQANNPYDEIYSIKAVVRPKRGEQPSTNHYWGLVDPDLLDPRFSITWHEPLTTNNALAAEAPSGGDPWAHYLRMLGIAESFHDDLGKLAHPHTFCFHGLCHETADVIELKIESIFLPVDVYQQRGFCGLFTNVAGKPMKATLQPPAGAGDGTVPMGSGNALDAPLGSGNPEPGDDSFDVEHQPAYEDAEVLDYTRRAIISLAKLRYEGKRGKVK